MSLDKMISCQFFFTIELNFHLLVDQFCSLNMNQRYWRWCWAFWTCVCTGLSPVEGLCSSVYTWPSTKGLWSQFVECLKQRSEHFTNISNSTLNHLAERQMAKCHLSDTVMVTSVDWNLLSDCSIINITISCEDRSLFRKRSEWLTFGQMTFGQMTFGQMTFGQMTFGQMTKCL